jgi:hypothetical protein
MPLGKERRKSLTNLEEEIKATSQQLLIELRKKYLVILKSVYWEFFEKG